MYREYGEHSVQIFSIVCLCLLLIIPACKPVPKDSLTLLYTSDTTGQIEPCG